MYFRQREKFYFSARFVERQLLRSLPFADAMGDLIKSKNTQYNNAFMKWHVYRKQMER